MTTRPYRKEKRRRQEEETRRRIVEATAALHEEVGPAATTISAIAQRARVQRLTVYRHFQGEGPLFEACSAHFMDAHPWPDPQEWAGIQDPPARFRAALEALYGYYRGAERMLANVLRDAERLPALAEVLGPFREYIRELEGSLAAGWGVRGSAQRLLRAAVGHAVRFDTWRSLAGQGLSDGEAARLMGALAAGVLAAG